MTDVTATTMLEQPTVGRSLWGDAWARLKANRAAMVSLFYLALVTIVCIVGPFFVPHQYTTSTATMCARRPASPPIRRPR